MKKSSGLIFAGLVIAMLVFGAGAVFAEMSNVRCVFSLHKAAKELAGRDFPGEIYVNIPESNDYQCFEEANLESMANAVFVLHFGIGTEAKTAFRYFGIFHIHFTNEGKLLSAASFYENKWQPAVDAEGKIEDWKKPWCEIIKLVYPSELAEQGCVK